MKRPLAQTALLGGYSLLWRMLQPVLQRHKRLRDDFPLRLVPDAWGFGGNYAASHGFDLWVQAASGGEAFLAKQLLGELYSLCAAKQRRLRILCTSCTRQGLDVLEKAGVHAAEQWPLLDVHIRVFPLDAPETMRRAVHFASPRAVVLLETELWPGLMAACMEKAIPIAVINGRMTPKSFAGYRWLAPVWRALAPEKVLAMSDADAALFAALFGDERVSLMPNMKFDGMQEAPPYVAVNFSVSATLPYPMPVILLASVRREEEKLLLPVINSLREQAPEAVIVVAPRHMERVPAWLEHLAAVPSPLRSALGATGDAARPGQVVVWDRFGELTMLYARADAVFVGGSLAPLGGQNFLESAGQGCIPVIGPHWKNFAWVGDAFFTSGLGIQVPDAESLAPTLVELLQKPFSRQSIREKMAAYVAPRRGGTRKAAESLLALLEKSNATRGCGAAS